MNFTWMPELEWAHGFLATTFFTLIAAIIPLAYIRQKGRLRLLIGIGAGGPDARQTRTATEP